VLVSSVRSFLRVFVVCGNPSGGWHEEPSLHFKTVAMSVSGMTRRGMSGDASPDVWVNPEAEQVKRDGALGRLRPNGAGLEGREGLERPVALPPVGQALPTSPASPHARSRVAPSGGPSASEPSSGTSFKVRKRSIGDEGESSGP
jgi:hypothetical protein